MSRLIVENLGKKYKHYATRWGRLLEALSGGRLVRHEAHWVLRGVTFQVAPGESLGIIGLNGAGKTTLLKILTGTTVATEGAVRCEGRVAALLELGMGFHPEFNGRQNAIMGCQMMGLAGDVIDKALPGIVEFAELGDYIDEPYRIYSTGMQMRLAFSVATAVRPDILIVDEALSVGDAYFQHKSIRRIRQFREQGTSLLFVSHDPGMVKTLCDRAILLDQGIIVREGTPDGVLDYYNAIIVKQTKDLEIRQIEQQYGKIITRSGNERAQIISAEITDKTGRPTRAYRVGEEATIKCRVKFNARVEEPTVGFMIRDRLGNDIFGTSTFHLGQKCAVAEPGDVFDVRFRLALNLGPGQYSLTIAVHTGPTHLENNMDWWDNLLAFQVVPGDGSLFIGVAALQVSGQWVAVVTGGNGDNSQPALVEPQPVLRPPKDSRQTEGLTCILEVSLENDHLIEGSLLKGTVKGMNNSELVWLPGSAVPGGVVLGCHLLNEGLETINHDFYNSSLAETDLPIYPGDHFERAIEITAPDPGNYVFEFDLVSHNVCWFATYESTSVRIPISVERARMAQPEDRDGLDTGRKL